jgi:hypothetical protein
MAYARAIKRGKRTYYYLVEGIREGNKVRQKHLRYMGIAKPSPEAVQRAIAEIKGVKPK